MRRSTHAFGFAVGILVGIVSAPARVLAIDFDTEIVPVLTRAGCNVSACHGAAAGRGEFRLSLFGGNPAADFSTIVHDLEGRRINTVKPRESLVFKKSTGQLPHGGDVVLNEDSVGARKLIAWITAGASRDATRRLKQFEVEPRDHIIEQALAEVPLRATAYFDDGVQEDVTIWTVFSANDPASIKIDLDRNVATVLRRGQHTITARFLDRVVPIVLTLPLSDAPVDLKNEPRANFIDDEVLTKLAVLRIPIAPATDDSAYLRRVCLALTGTLPTRAEAESYLEDHSADKQARLVERLIAGDAFIDYWTFRFATLLRIHTIPNDRQGARVYHAWLRDQIRLQAPLDHVVRELLTAVGDSHVSGPANFARMTPDARSEAELVSQVFLGARLQCANCHNHPLDRWIQDDYHGLAAVFSRIERGRTVTLAARGAVTNPRTGEPAIPKLPGGRFLDANNTDCRVEFADWLTKPDNPYFARAIVNRLWSAMLGRGLVGPVDDLRATNPATHPELLDKLAADFVAHRYDFRRTLRLIARSETFRRAAISSGAESGAAADDRYYSRSLHHPLEPEVLADAIAMVTGVSDKYGDELPGTRAIVLFDPATPSISLDTLGRCSRAMSCEGVAVGGGLPAKLHLLNGELINRKITAADGRLHRFLAAGSSDQAIIEDFYLRALSRRPSPAELDFWQLELADVGSIERTQRLEDFAWSLLNSDAFTTNH